VDAPDTLYKKVGRRYHPVGIVTPRLSNGVYVVVVNGNHTSYVRVNGGHANAEVISALSMLKREIVDRLVIKSRPSGVANSVPLTERQQEILETEFGGGPISISYPSLSELVDEAIDSIRETAIGVTKYPNKKGNYMIILSYWAWREIYEEEMSIADAESGADRELDYDSNLDQIRERQYEAYVMEQIEKEEKCGME
jgi:hypothetical protein